MYGLVLLALFVAWLTAFSVTAGFVYRKAQSPARGIARVFGIAAGFVLVAWLAYWYPLDSYARKQATYLAFCEARAVTLHARRDTAGFAVGRVADVAVRQSVADALAPNGFDYVDMLDFRPGARDGAWLRLSVSSDGDPRCVLDDETSGRGLRMIAELVEEAHPESACLTANPVDPGAARYLLTYLSRTHPDHREIGLLNHFILDRQTGGILAERPAGSRNFGHPFGVDAGYRADCESAAGSTAELVDAALRPSVSTADTATDARPMDYEEYTAWVRANRSTPLRLAIQEPGTWSIRMLLTNGYDVNTLYKARPSLHKDTADDVEGHSMLREAIHAGREDLVWLLIREGAPLDRPLGNYVPMDNYLRIAVRSSSVDVVDALLTARVWPREIMDYVARDALGSGDNRLRLAAVLLKHGADPDRLLAGVLFDRTAAAAPIIEYLFANGARVHTEGPFAQPARYALQHGAPETRTLLRAQLAKQ